MCGTNDPCVWLAHGNDNNKNTTNKDSKYDT